MKNISLKSLAIRPVRTASFIDILAARLDYPLSRPLLRRIKRHCGDVHYAFEPLTYKGDRPWRLELKQPRREALLPLLVLEGVHPNFLQIALDWIFLTEEDHFAAHVFALRHSSMPYNRGYYYYDGEGPLKTVYFADRFATRKLSIYSDRPSKAAQGTIYEGLPCVHIEWTLNKYRTLEREELGTIRDILNLDLREFWSRHLSLKDIDAPTFGRAILNRNEGTSRRRRVIKQDNFTYDEDRSSGNLVIRNYDYDFRRNIYEHPLVHSLRQAYKNKFNFYPSLMRMQIDHLLPDINASS